MALKALKVGRPITKPRAPSTASRNRTPRLLLKNLQRRIKVDGRPLRTFLRQVAGEVAPPGASASLVFVGDERMRYLNRTFRGYDRPTDVLSFPARAGDFPDEADYLGDIVISVETARRQARRRGSTLPRELRVLALHGLLHLLGYDHETDQGEMRRIEYRMRRKYGITRRRATR
jgi:probable rRNA maturation factor